MDFEILASGLGREAIRVYSSVAYIVQHTSTYDGILDAHVVFSKVTGCLLWHFRLWSFQGRDTKLERFLAKNQLCLNEITKF